MRTALDLLRPDVADDRPALATAPDAWMDHGTLRAAVDRAMRAMPRDRKALVVIVLRAEIPAVVAHLAALAAGHAVLLLDRAMPAPTLAGFVARCRPSLVLVPPDADPGLPAPYVRRVGGGLGMGAFERAGDDAAEPHPALGLLLPTSGSTGSPRLVRLAYDAVAHNTDAIVASLGIGPDDRAAAHLPLAYAFGLSVVASHLRAGASALLRDDGLLAPGFWPAVRAAGCTGLPGVPFHCETLARLGLDRLDVPTLRTVTQAGGRCAPAALARLHAAMEARGGRLMVMYGQTEAGPRMAVLPHDRFPARPGSVGWALPGGRFEVTGPDGAPLPPGAEGDVVYHGPNVMMGHADTAEDLARPDGCGGRLETGDLGSLDAEGALTLVGRRSRFAKVMGLRLALDRVEAMAAGIAPAVAAERDGRLRVTVEGDAAAATAVRTHLAASLGLAQAAIEARAVPALPRLASGKPDHQALAQEDP